MAASPLRALEQGAGPAIHVTKDHICGGCSAWIDIPANEGFAVKTERSFGTLLVPYKLDNGMPQQMVSRHFHTAASRANMIESHIPIADIRRLLDERLDAVGLAVPGTP